MKNINLKSKLRNTKTRARNSKLGSSYRSHKKAWICLAIIAAILTSYGIYYYINNFAIAPTEGTISFKVLDPLAKNAGDGEVADITKETKFTAWESPNLDALTDKQIQNLNFNDDYDKIVEETTADKASVQITDNHYVIGKFEYKGSEFWTLLSMPSKGTVLTIYIWPQTSAIDADVVCNDDSSEVFASTDQSDWHIDIKCDDHEGLKSGYHYDDGKEYVPILIFTFDNVPVPTDVDVKDYAETKTVVGNVLYCELSGDILNTATIHFTLSDDIIVGNPNAVSLEFNHGQADNLVL